MKIDVYDFDKTIYAGDCSLDFYFFCLRRQPLLIRYLPLQLAHAAAFALRLENRTRFKAGFFSFLRGLNDVDQLMADFWQNNFSKIAPWYLKENHASDVIVSASPEFLLELAASRLNVKALIATRMDKNTGQIEGENCRGKEKVRRLKQILPNAKVRRVYTDHASDAPILELAKEKYIVRRNKVRKLKAL